MPANSLPGRCRDCQWWGDDERRYFDGDDRYSDGYRVCRLADSDGVRPCNEQTKAYAIDAESFIGNLLTAPDFGCVQFEARDA